MNNQMIGTIKKHTSYERKVFLCPELASFFQKGDIITVKYGQEYVEAEVVPIKNNQTVYLSSIIWNKLSIPFSHKVHFHIEDQTLHIGPLVGLITYGVRPDSQAPVGDRTGFFRRFLYSQKQVPSSFFLFSPADISYENQRIKGHFLRKQNGKVFFERHTVPFPDVVYNRVFRRSEKMYSFIKAKDRLETAGVKIFNPFCFNKWDIHQRIHQIESVKPYLPESILNPNRSQLAALLKKYKTVYLKPADGYLGLGIVEMTYRPYQGIYCRYNSNQVNYLKRFSNIQSALRHIFGSKSLKGYIAQQGIKLLEINGRRIDVRVHTNKNRYGEWKMTAAVAKMSGRGSVTTHIRTGGEMLSLHEILSTFFPGEEHTIHEELEKAVLALSKAIEESLPGYVGDIGFDIGIDHAGQPWMFEANSQPGRHIFAHPSMKENDVMNRKMILDYALYLANFTSKEVSK